MNVELKYIRFDDLLNDILVDLRVLDEEGMIEPAQLIKVAQQVNYDLGLRIHQTKETIIDIENHVGKLPEDFYVLNFALLLGHHSEVVDVDWSGRVIENVTCSTQNEELTTCPCWSISCTSTTKLNITYCDSTSSFITVSPNGDGSASITNICALSLTLSGGTNNTCCPSGYIYVNSLGQYTVEGITFTINNFQDDVVYDRCFKIFNGGAIYEPPFGPVDAFACPTGAQITQTGNFCYKNSKDNTYSCTKPSSESCAPNCNTTSTTLLHNTCTPEEDPWFQRKVYSLCEGNTCVKVVDKRKEQLQEYSWFERLYIKPQHYLDPGSINSKLVECHSAEIKNGYLYCSVPCAKVFIAYEGALVDEDNNLLVLDHPVILEYYRTALTEKIFKNLWYSGEEIKGKLDFAKQETREARAQALSIVNMPNFQEMYDVWRANRTANYKRYYEFFHTSVFSSFYKFTNLPF